MSAQEAILSRLKKTGHRLTPQRLMILAVIDEEGGHVGPDRVFERVKEQYPYIDIATVRQTLLNEVGFEPHTEHFTISGLCSECRSTDKHRVTNPADNEGHHVG